ncbi:MAG: hypothetical protein JNN01_14075 [Opitutaceae bacterium]|nr:hypothetical protein [Opitutaceae bacterium]
MLFPFIGSTVDLKDPVKFDAGLIDEAVKVGLSVRVLFSKRVPSRNTLSQLDSLCRLYGGSIQVRFQYVHDPIEPGEIRQIPCVRHLSLSVVRREGVIPALRELPRLLSLELTSVFNLSGETGFLRYPNLAALEGLILSAVHDRRVDLEPLEGMRNLRYLALHAQERGIAAMSGLPIETLHLTGISGRCPLEFLGTLRSLHSLSVVRGGRTTLNEVQNSSLRELALLRIQGLSDANLLQGFPNLESLQLSTQGRLTTLNLSHTPRIVRLQIAQCSSLRSLIGLGKLSRLYEVAIGGTAIDFDELESSGFPASVRAFYFATKDHEVDSVIRRRLDQKGYFPRTYCEFPQRSPG